MSDCIIFRYISNSIPVCIFKRLHVSCNSIPRFQFPAIFHDCLIFQIFNWISVLILWFKRQQTIGHFHYRAKHLSCIQVSHNMVQFIILNFNSFSIFSGQITVRHLIQNHSMRIICKIQSAAIQSCSCHKIRNRSVYFCCQLQFFSCQICIDKRISCHTVFSNSQRKRIVNILYCNIAFCICVTDRSAWHNRYIYRIPIVIL